MRVIVTGGNGFLGSNVVRKLLKEKHEVFVISNNTNNIVDILPQIKYSSDYTDDIMHFKPDVIIHFGWKGGNSAQDAQHINQFYDNMPMSLDLVLKACSLTKKPKFIGVGSFAEYGDYLEPIEESYLEHPNTLYGLTKLTLKNYTVFLCSQHGIEWSWIRPCYVYGPGDVKTRLIPTTVNKCLDGLSIELDACNKWIDYLYIDDFCNYVYYLTTSQSKGVYNLCSGHQYYLQDVIKLIHKLTNNTNTVTFSNLNKDVVKWMCGDNIKIASESGYRSLTDFETGIIKTINFYKNAKPNSN